MNKAFSIIWVLGMVIVLAGGGILVWQKMKSPAPTAQDETSAWQTYRNEEYGFEIKYPEDFLISCENTCERGYLAAKAVSKTNFIQKKWENGETDNPIISIEIYSANLPMKQWVENNFTVGSQPNGLEPYVGRGKEIIEAKVYNYSVLKFDEFFSAGSAQYTIFQNKNTLLALINARTPIGDITNVYNQMLSTFRFIENKSVKLSEVINYSFDVRVNNYVKTEGTVIGLSYDDYGGEILLTDNSGNYLLVAICHACVSQYLNILPIIKKGDTLEVKGRASFTEPKDLNLKTKYNITQRLPEKMGMLSLEGDIKINGKLMYRNEQYGFEFSYPPNFKQMANVETGAILSFQDQSNMLPRLSTLPDIYLKVLDIPAGKDFKEVLIKDVIFDGSGKNPKSFTEFSQKKIGNNDAYFIRSGLFEGILSANYYLVRGDKIFAFYLHSSPVDWTSQNFKSEKDVLNLKLQKIISTFKFL